MQGLRDIIYQISGPRAAPRRLPEIPTVKKSADRIRIVADGEGIRHDRDYDTIAAQLISDLEADCSLARRQLADAVWCLWATEPALTDHQNLMQKLLVQIERSDRPKLIRALAASYLQSYEPGLTGGDRIAALLAKLSASARAPYDRLHSEVSIFDPEVGVQRVAQMAVQDGTSVPFSLSASGLGHQTSYGGFSRHATIAALEHLEKDSTLDAGDRITKVTAIALDAEHDLIFEGLRPSVANALLKPYLQKDPPKPDRDNIIKLLLELIGDPRTHPARWAPMPAARDVALRWFTEQSLRQFLDIVDRVADPGMWRYRRAFWEAVHSYGLIDSAWVVFEGDGAREARRQFGQKTNFGRFSGQVQSGQAVLILQIGSSLVAEWSHNGRCHIWNDAGAGPRLFKTSYSPGELRATRSGNTDGPHLFSHAHMSPETYSWQRKVAHKIYRLTGVRMSQADYKIGRYG